MVNYKINNEMIEVKDARLAQVIDDLDSEHFDILNSTIVDPATNQEISYKALLKKIGNHGGVPDYQDIKLLVALIQRLPNFFQIGRAILIKGLKEYDEILEERSEAIQALNEELEDSYKKISSLDELNNNLLNENNLMKNKMYVLDTSVMNAKLSGANEAMNQVIGKMLREKNKSKKEEVVIDFEEEKKEEVVDAEDVEL